MCLILGQGVTQFTLLKKKLREGYIYIYMVREETDKTASDIQPRSFMARTLERNVKER